MDTIEELNDFILNGDKVYMPHLTIDCVIFGYENKQLKVLICKWIGMEWGLPGGFIKWFEPITEAAKRILNERTSLDDIFLKQFQVFGDSPYRMNIREYVPETWANVPPDSWSAKRTLSIGYYALMDCSKAKVKLDLLVQDYKWVNVNEIPENLMFDNNEIVNFALLALRNQIFLEPIGFELLPDKFTLPEIQVLYETILDKKFDRRHFPKKLISLGIIEKLDEKKNIGQHRSPFLYRFHEHNYHNALNDSIKLTI